MGNSRSAASALREFAENGWPADEAGIRAMQGSLKRLYGDPTIGVSRWPEIEPTPAQREAYEGSWPSLAITVKQFEAWGKRWPGHCYQFEFANGQTISVVISNEDGRVIERRYSDRGNIPIRKVYEFLKAWQSAFKQARLGGPRPPSDDEMVKMVTEWQEAKRLGQLKENFCQDNGITPPTLRAWEKKLVQKGLMSLNRK